MAVRPDECGPLTELEKNQIAECEAKIDAWLKEHYRSGFEEFVHCALCIDLLSKKAKKEIKRRYESQGWTIRNVGGPGIGESSWYFAAEGDKKAQHRTSW